MPPPRSLHATPSTQAHTNPYTISNSTEGEQDAEGDVEVPVGSLRTCAASSTPDEHRADTHPYPATPTPRGHTLISIVWYLMSGLYLVITEVAVSMVHCVDDSSSSASVSSLRVPRAILVAAPTITCYSTDHMPGLVLAWACLGLVTAGAPLFFIMVLTRAHSWSRSAYISRNTAATCLRRCIVLALLVVVGSVGDGAHNAARVARMVVCCVALAAYATCTWWCTRPRDRTGTRTLSALHVGCALAASGVAVGSAQPYHITSPTAIVWASTAATVAVLLACLWVFVGQHEGLCTTPSMGASADGLPSALDSCSPTSYRHQHSNFGTPLCQHASLATPTTSVEEQNVVLVPVSTTSSSRWSMRGVHEGSATHLLPGRHGASDACGTPDPRLSGASGALVATLQGYRGALVGSAGAVAGGSSMAAAACSASGDDDSSRSPQHGGGRPRSRRLPPALWPLSTDPVPSPLDGSRTPPPRRRFPPSPSPSSPSVHRSASPAGSTGTAGGTAVPNPLTPASVAGTGLRYRRVLLRPTFSAREGDRSSKQGGHREAEYQRQLPQQQQVEVRQLAAASGPSVDGPAAVVVHEVVVSRR